jgi:hypothetical protein
MIDEETRIEEVNDKNMDTTEDNVELSGLFF